MDDLKDILSKKADELGLARYDIMIEAKLLIVDMLHIEIRVLSYKNNVLTIATEDSVSASELRFHVHTIIAQLNKKAPQQVSFIKVMVR